MSVSKAAVEGVAGGLGSLVALFATYPLKTIYTLQAINAVKRRNKGPGLAAELRAVATNPIKALSVLCEDLHLSSLYAGMGPAAVETAASSAIYFYFYSLLRQAVVAANKARRGGRSGSVRDENIGVVASLGVAALAAAGNQLITTPAQVITTQMQARAKLRQQLAQEGQPHEHVEVGAWAVTKQIYEEDGVAGFWKGLLPSLVLVVNPMVQYALFERFMAQGLRRKERRLQRAAAAVGPARAPLAVVPAVKIGPGEVFLIGALAKIGATIVTYPMIVVKSRLQAMGRHSDEHSSYLGTTDAIARIWSQEGPGGFFKGLPPKVLQTAINAALMLMIKDRITNESERLLGALAGAKSRVQGTAVYAVVYR